jgi:hypothetical protein
MLSFCFSVSSDTEQRDDDIDFLNSSRAEEFPISADGQTFQLGYVEEEIIFKNGKIFKSQTSGGNPLAFAYRNEQFELHPHYRDFEQAYGYRLEKVTSPY